MKQEREESANWNEEKIRLQERCFFVFSPEGEDDSWSFVMLEQSSNSAVFLSMPWIHPKEGCSENTLATPTVRSVRNFNNGTSSGEEEQLRQTDMLIPLKKGYASDCHYTLAHNPSPSKRLWQCQKLKQRRQRVGST